MKWLELFFDFLRKLFDQKPPDTEEEPPVPRVVDDIPAGEIVFDDGDGVGNWPITVEITDIFIDKGKLYWTQKGATWPNKQLPGWKKPSIGNIWVFGRKGGAWHGATWDWLGPTQRVKQLPKFEDLNDIHGPLEGWFPVSGETVGFMISTFARDNTRSLNERSQIVKVVWP